MPGRQEFEAIVAAAAKKKLVNFFVTNSAPMTATSNEYTKFFAPANTIVKVIAISLQVGAPAGATTGDHSMVVGYETPNVDIFTGRHDKAVNISFQNGIFSTATLAKSPDTSEALITYMNSIVFDSISPIRIAYLNGTNAAQNNNRIIAIWGIQETLG